MEHALILNASFEPINIVHWKKAIQLVFQGKVEILEESERMVRTVTRSIRLPSVLRLIRFIPTNRRKNMIRFSRENILLRDRYACQYCGRKRPNQDLTLDHVTPAAQGGKRTWDNIVAACLQCNQKKGNRTPGEAGMTLIQSPLEPTWLPSTEVEWKIESTPRQWIQYIQWSKSR